MSKTGDYHMTQLEESYGMIDELVEVLELIIKDHRDDLSLGATVLAKSVIAKAKGE